jgi:hypothetical protein
MKQLCNFEGMKWGTITPTDIDLSIDFGGKLFVFVEYKHEDKQVPFGQKKHLEYLVKSILKSGAKAVAAIARHSQSTDEDIACKDAIVDEIYCVKPKSNDEFPTWQDRSSKNISVIQWIDNVVAFYGIVSEPAITPTASCKRIDEVEFLEVKGYPASWATTKSELEIR